MSSSHSDKQKMSLFSYLSSEVTRGYQLEHDEERYTTRREKMYTFMKIPRELEKFMSYGFFHCLDSFLFVFTFLPIRILLAILALFWRGPLVFFGLIRPYHGRTLYPAEIIDLFKGLIIAVCVYAMTFIDTSMMYHLIKSQSVIKLYLFYNMLEVGDRLFSAFGQDTIDALFWTATEPRNRKRETIGVIPHFLLAATYVFLHGVLVMLQATTLNVAINASNKALLTIMMSNNFVELKGSVFKKFDKLNLFQVSCSDVRERFHLFALLFIVVVQTMKEYGWREESFWSLSPDCLLVLSAEFLVDWIKHAFITRFNEVPAEVYKDYTISLAYDLAQTKQKHAFSDHSDLVSRRMGFIPLPLGVVMIRVIGSAIRFNGPAAPVILGLVYLCLLTFRILGSIVILGKACDLIDLHQQQQQSSKQTATTAAEAKTSKVSEQEEEVPKSHGEESQENQTASPSSASPKIQIIEVTSALWQDKEDQFESESSSSSSSSSSFSSKSEASETTLESPDGNDYDARMASGDIEASTVAAAPDRSFEADHDISIAPIEASREEEEAASDDDDDDLAEANDDNASLAEETSSSNRLPDLILLQRSNTSATTTRQSDKTPAGEAAVPTATGIDRKENEASLTPVTSTPVTSTPVTSTPAGHKVICGDPQQRVREQQTTEGRRKHLSFGQGDQEKNEIGAAAVSFISGSKDKPSSVGSSSSSSSDLVFQSPPSSTSTPTSSLRPIRGATALDEMSPGELSPFPLPLLRSLSSPDFLEQDRSKDDDWPEALCNSNCDSSSGEEEEEEETQLADEDAAQSGLVIGSLSSATVTVTAAEAKSKVETPSS